MSRINIQRKAGIGGLGGLRNQPLPLKRIAQQPWWLVRDLAPTRFEARRPARYVRAVVLWLKVRQQGFTMLGCRRGRYLYELADEASQDGVLGALVDCGVWNGGSTALLSAGAPDRQVWAFDSFEGMPEPGGSQVDGLSSVGWVGDCVGAEDNVREAMRRYGSPEHLHICKGWFKDTLKPAAPSVGSIAVLHADGDWYESIRLTLEAFYDQVSAGGFVAIDDYFTFDGARRATDEFRASRGITASLVLRETGVHWRV